MPLENFTRRSLPGLLSVSSVPSRGKAIEVATLIELLAQIIPRLPDELGAYFFLAIGPDDARLYRPSISLFGADVDRVFPKTEEDISEAGKCLALERPTACVFHLMRAMEAALQVLARHLGVVDVDRDWGKLLSDIKPKIEALPKGAPRDAWSEDFSLLYHVKQAWRNDTMHPKQTYTMAEARAIFDAVKSFMGHLARHV